MDSSLINVTFEVPPHVKQGIDSGELKIFGGVVRDGMGQIVCHLKEAGIQNAKNINKGNLRIIAGLIAAIAIATCAYYVIKKLKPKEKRELSHQLNTIDKNIKDYFHKGAFL